MANDEQDVRREGPLRRAVLGAIRAAITAMLGAGGCPHCHRDEVERLAATLHPRWFRDRRRAAERLLAMGRQFERRVEEVGSRKHESAKHQPPPTAH